MNTQDTAIILIGYQHDYFDKKGILHDNIEKSSTVKQNTISLLNRLVNTDVLIVTTPIMFTPDYSELHNPVGILDVVKKVGAFKRGSIGSEIIPQIKKYGDRITEISGKFGLNAFENTSLGDILKEHNIKNVVLAGAITSVCIDSTGRSAFEKNYNVIQLRDCTSARSEVEHNFYCDIVFPIYSRVLTSEELLTELGVK